MASIFDSKTFNPEVFGQYVETVPRIKQDALVNAGVLRTRGDLKTRLTDQVGGNYITVPLTGLIGGDAQNYDGNTSIEATGIDTYSQSMIVAGRAKAWKEKDFTFDITGKDFMEEIAKQVALYWQDVDQATMLSILDGIFSMEDDSGFVENHTYDTTETDTPIINATTLNNAIQKAAGANKNIFTLVIMHSTIATTLENLQLLNYFQGTDENGLIRDTALATWNGRTVLIDDDVPVDGDNYTAYVLGQGAFDYIDCGAKTPYETYRNPTEDGGTDMLITRQRKLWAPKGISYINTDKLSPMDDDFATAANWQMVKSTEGTYYNHKAIPICKIIAQPE